MFDIGFWELLIIAVVLLLVMGPERLPEVAKQAAFLLRKARHGMHRLRSEMKDELDVTPFNGFQKTHQELTDLKNDIKQFGRELADSAEETKSFSEVKSDDCDRADEINRSDVSEQIGVEESDKEKKMGNKVTRKKLKKGTSL